MASEGEAVKEEVSLTKAQAEKRNNNKTTTKRYEEMNTNSMAAAATNAAKPQTAVAKAQEKKAMSPSVYVGNMLANYKDAIKQALPSVITPERFTRIATTVVASSPKLYQAVVESPQTFIGALMTAAQLGIEPNTPLGQGYLIPFNNFNKAKGKKVMEVSFQLGVYGVIDLAYRSGEVTEIYARTVYENDEFKYVEGLDRDLKHVPYRGGDRGDAIAYYAVFKTKTGAKDFAVMWKDEVLAHAKRFSKSYYANSDSFSGPWETDFDRMAEKTVLLRVLKYAPKKTDFARALSLDNTVKSTLDKDMSTVSNDDVIDAEATVVDGEPIPAEPALATAAPTKKQEPKKDGEKDVADLI